MNYLKSVLKNNIRQYGMLIALVFIMVLFAIITGGITLKPANISSLIGQNSYILILAIGMVLCILTGGNIDLSVGAIVIFVGGVAGWSYDIMGFNAVVTTILALGSGIMLGVWQGFWIAYLRIPAFIVTLSGMLTFRGLGNILLDGLNRDIPEFFKVIANGEVKDFIGGADAPIHVTTVLIGILVTAVFIVMEVLSRRKKARNGFELIPFFAFVAKLVALAAAINLLTIWLAQHKGLPNVLILLTVLIAIYSFITMRTVTGRHIYAVGGNEKAAKLSGVKTDRILFLVYANMGMLAAVSAIVVSGRLATASQQAGQGFELDAIASCFIGGASATGGVGTVMGAIIGGFIMGVLNNGMSIAGWDSFWQQVIKGMVLLLAVIFDVVSKSKK